MTQKETKKSRLKEFAEDLKVIAGDAVKEAAEVTWNTAEKATSRVKAVTEKVSKEAGRTVKEVKETVDNKKIKVTEFAEDAKTIVTDAVKETEEKIEAVTGKWKGETAAKGSE